MRYPLKYGTAEAIYSTPPVKIGKHDWVYFVYEEGGRRYTSTAWRIAACFKHGCNWEAGNWEAEENWPTYDHNDGVYAGCPKSLRTRVWDPHRAEIRAALGEAVPA